MLTIQSVLEKESIMSVSYTRGGQVIFEQTVGNICIEVDI